MVRKLRETIYDPSEIYKFVQANPGCSATELAQQFTRNDHSGEHILKILEDRGYLLSEDRYNGLHAFDVVEV